MKTLSQNIIITILLSVVPSVWGYTNLTPAEVHNRLIQGDTVLLLDVREVSEYRAGHMAEPLGQLPLTPVNMPWNSNVLSVEYYRLPKNIDIIVYCRFGGRSAAASSFLESKGFTRIFNMTGGLSSWAYEHRDKGFGDHSGQWVRSSDVYPVTITCSATGDTSKIVFPPDALPGTDSIYIELHFASSQVPIPPDVPGSDLEGLFRLTALDRFGLSQFVSDSLSLSDTVNIELFPKYQADNLPIPLKNQNMTVYVPDEGWRAVPYYFDSFSFHRDELILRRWYNIEGFLCTGIKVHPPPTLHEIQVFPNPFNSSVQIVAPSAALISIYTIQGKYIGQLKSRVWSPHESVGSGLYFVNVRYSDQRIIKRVVYLK